MPSSTVDTATWLDRYRVELGHIPDSEIVGIGHVLTHCRSIVGRIRYESAAATSAGLAPVRSILLQGPPGSGKTLVSRWIAGQLGAIPAYDLPTEQLDPERIRTVFAHLSAQPRSVLFLPEIDVIGCERRDSDRASRTRLFALLEGLDGLVPLQPGLGPVVIATTNRQLFELDRALVRPGRLGSPVVVFGSPTPTERVALFQRFAAGWIGEAPIDWERLADLSPDWSPADIRGAVEDAVGLALARTDAVGRLSDDDLVAAVRRAGRIEAETEDPYIDPRAVAIHEAGHVAVALALGLEVRSVTMGPSQRSGRTRVGVEGVAATERELRLGAVVAMAGAAAEERLCGVATVGSATDVRRATDGLISRIEAGLDPDFPPISRRAWGGSWTPKAIDERIAPRVMELLTAARVDAKAIVEDQAAAIALFAEALLVEPVLTGQRLESAIRLSGVRLRAVNSRDGYGRP